jgi:hypothetical protein
MNRTRLTRRAVAAALAGSPIAAASAQAPEQREQKPVQAEVRQQLTRNLESLRKAEVSIFTEPSFAFRTL